MYLKKISFCAGRSTAETVTVLYLNVFTPFAEAYHYESASRGSDLTGEAARRYNEESARFREKWKDVLEAGDPYYNPNFSLDKSDFSLRV